MIFEGVSEGKGQLVLTFWKGTQKIGEGGGVWLDVKNVLKMYQRSYGKPGPGSVPWKRPNEYNPYQEPVVAIAPLDKVPFEQPPDETKETFVFVHGIHGLTLLTEEQAIKTYRAAASTAFKRLWWQGFKGRFGFYKWEAHHISQFNESEYRAWKCGRGLALFLAQLPGDSKHVWTYSQGAVVGSSAIRDYGATPNTLIVMQAAIPAVCYDDNAALNIYPNALPDTVAELGYRGYHVPATTSSAVINFSDPTDNATGPLWRAAQFIKPEPGYSYNPATAPGARQMLNYVHLGVPSGRFVTDLHESLPMIAKAQSQSIA